MDKLYGEIVKIVSRDPGNRGILPNIIGQDAKKAAELIKGSRRPVIVTGFPIAGTGAGENDGPIGSAALCRALRLLGKEAYVVTDEISAGLVAACLKALELPQECLYVLPMSVSLSEGATLTEKLAPDLVIALERPGKGEDGHFHNMRGEIIDNLVADTDWLLSLPAPSVGIGDGGNELGMGAVRDIVAANVANGSVSTAVKHADVTLVSGISNWWGWGLCALLSAECGRDVMTTEKQEKAMLKAIIEAGGVDGVLRLPSMSVDGVSLEENMAVHSALRKTARKWVK